jgi:phosphatidylserine/phosphatidylglycerophosphate/cardiolipin synthase-like enzyme
MRSSHAHPHTSSHTLIIEPDAGITAIYDLLQSATKSIDMTMYELVDTKAEQILAQQAAKGVAVRVILDQNLEKSSNTAAFTYLAAHGVKVVWAAKTYAATHQKTITLDGATSAIMTLNLDSVDYAGTRDFALINTDPADVAAIETTFNADFTAAAITPPTGTDLVWSPTNSQTALLGLIASATSTLAVENEEMSDAAIVSALEAAAKRGVAVQITMSANPDYATELDALDKAGAQIRTYAQTASLYIHAKVIVADASKAFLGSENFSSASLTKNRELGIILSDAGVIESLQTTLASDFAGGTPFAGAAAMRAVTDRVRKPS